MRNRFLERTRGALLVLMIACVCGWLAAPAGGAERYDDVSVSITVPPAKETSHGYTEYRVALTNHSAKQAHTVTLYLPDDSYGSGHHIRRVTRTTSVAPSSQAIVSLFVPPLEIGGSGLRVIIDGRTQRRPVRVNVSRSVSTGSSRRSRSYYGGYDEDGQVLVMAGRDVDPVVTTGLLSELSNEPRFGGGSAPLQPARAELDVQEWSTKWLAYSCYDGVIVTEEEMARMRADARSALWQWVECGGTLVVLGHAQVPATWRGPRHERDGTGSTSVGFGQCIEVAEASLDGSGGGVAETVASALRTSFKPLSTSDSVEEANDAFPVVEGLNSPVRGLMILMLVFVVIIGPVNLLVLSKFKRRIWLLWTVPVISLLTCGAVTLYAAIAEGWTGRARAETLTILDQGARRATTIGWTAFYCPVTPRSGLTFSTVTELSPQVGPQWDYYGYRGDRSGRAREVDWTSDQHLTSGWVSARVPAHFRIRKSEMRHERLLVTTAADGSVTVLNGFGVNIESLWLADAGGKIRRANDIPAGKQIALGEPVANSTAHGTPEKLRSAYAQDWLTSTRALETAPASYLMPGTYIAVLDETPFIENGLRQARREKCRSIVYGIIGDTTESGDGQ